MMIALRPLMTGAAALALSLSMVSMAKAEKRTAIFAGGCFWCVESDFDHVTGVVSTTSGYIGGTKASANYKAVVSGGTGHYEAVKIVYDSEKTSYRKLLDVFWRSVDPTDPGGQFCDRGASYKTGIFVANDKELATAEASKKRAEEALGKQIVTPVLKAAEFYSAEGYHQDYYKKNPVRYKVYRYGCGRDQRIRTLWGDEAHKGIKKH